MSRRIMLKILLPEKVLLSKEVDQVTAEAENGSFCLKPRHIDFVTALVPGILSFVADAREEFVAVDEGILVKVSSEVLVSVSRAAYGAELGELQRQVEKSFMVMDEREKRTRSAAARLEANIVRRFMEMGQIG